MTGRRTECFELERICRRDESQLVASSGAVDNMYRHSVQSVVTLDDLFEEERG